MIQAHFYYWLVSEHIAAPPGSAAKASRYDYMTLYAYISCIAIAIATAIYTTIYYNIPHIQRLVTWQLNP